MSTPTPPADRIAQAVSRIFARAFPGRVRGSYLRGSHATGQPGPGSDLDMFVVFADGFQDRSEARAARALADDCAALSTTLLEIISVSEQLLARPDNVGLALALKLTSRPVSGDDIRPGLPEFSADPYVQWAADTPLHTYASHRDGAALPYPLTHRDPAGPFFGYDRWLVPGPAGEPEPSTRLLVASVCWTATALVALHAGRYVRDKGHSVASYRELIADEWTDLVVDVYTLCRDRWHYRIPTGADEQDRLRALCDRSLAFENHYLTRYRGYRPAEQSSGEPPGGGTRLAD